VAVGGIGVDGTGGAVVRLGVGGRAGVLDVIARVLHPLRNKRMNVTVITFCNDRRFIPTSFVVITGFPG
jgi:hypothetical protein